MAMITGSRLLILAGAGYSAVLLNNGKLAALLGELKDLVSGIEKSGDGGDADYADAVAQQVRRLAMEVRQLASARQVTVLNGGSGQLGNVIVPAATLGAVGYGYMWWKGIKFSDLMYVTKRSMTNAVSNLTKHLEQVSEAVSAAKKHLTQRIQHLDDKMEIQKEISKAIQDDVKIASENLAQIDSDLWQLQDLVSGLGLRMASLEEKQDVTNMGVVFLCNYVGGKKVKFPKALEDQLKPSGRTRSLTFPESPSLTGLKELTDNLSQAMNGPASVAPLQDRIDNIQEQPRPPFLQIDPFKPLLRFNSARC